VTREDKLRILADDSIRDLVLTKGNDRIEVKVTEDGRYRADVAGSISSVNHGNADSFLKDIARCLGGLLKITSHGHAHAHTHDHAHEHKH
jgi:hypothetical protein